MLTHYVKWHDLFSRYHSWAIFTAKGTEDKYSTHFAAVYTLAGSRLSVFKLS